MRPTFRFFAVALATLVFGGCGKDSTSPPQAMQIFKVGGDAQQGFTLLNEPESLTVKALDVNGSPVRGAVVTWEVSSGGGSLSASTSTTNDLGVAKTLWKLGPTKPTKYGGETQKVTASLATGPFVEFTASASISPDVTIERVSGDNQTGIVGGNLLPDSIIVVVKLPSGEVVPNAQVDFLTQDVNAQVYHQGTAYTDANGRVGALWALGTYSGLQTVKASLDFRNFESGVPPKEVTFTATARSGPPRFIYPYPGGCCNYQPYAGTGAVGTALPDSSGVAVYDAYGNLISDGVQVQWTPVWGSARPAVSSTVNGIAKTQWTLGTLVSAYDRNGNYPIGVQHLNATFAGATQSVQFVATATSTMTESFRPSPDTLAGTHFGGGCAFSASCRDTLYIVVAASSPSAPTTGVTVGVQATTWGNSTNGPRPSDSFEFVPVTSPLTLVYSNGAWRGQMSAQNFDFSLFIYILATATDAAGNQVTVPYQVN